MLLAAFIPFLAFLGMAFKWPLLTQGNPALPHMQALTASGLLIGAIGISLMDHGAEERAWRRAASSACGLLLILLGATVIAEYALQIDLGIDWRTVPLYPTALHPFPGRPSPQSAFNFFLLGISILLQRPRSISPYWFQAAALLAAANAMLSSLGYLFSPIAYFGFPMYEPATGIAINTSVSFVLLSYALLSSRPKDGIMSVVTGDTATGGIARRTVISALLAPPLLGMATHAGVTFGWYDIPAQASIFTVLLVALILRSTWAAIRRANSEEVRALEAYSELAESRARLDLALRGASLGAWDWDIPSGRVSFNERWAEMRGYQLSELEPHLRTWTGSTHPGDLAAAQKQLDRIWAGETDEYEAEFRTATKDGRWIWVLDRGRVFERDQHGKPLRMAGTELDITERKRAEQAILRSERSQAFLAEAGAVLGSTLNPEKVLRLSAGLAARELCDFAFVYLISPRGELLRLHGQSHDPAKQEACDRYCQHPIRFSQRVAHQLFVEGRSVLLPSIEPRFFEEFKDEPERLEAIRGLAPESLIAVPLESGERMLGVMALVSSDSARRLGPDELKVAEELAYRTAISMEKGELYQEARRAIKTRDEILAIVSHDLKNPLSVLAMVAQILRMPAEITSAQLAQFGQRMQRSIDQAQMLIGDLLDFGRIQGGTFSVSTKCQEPTTLVQQSVELVQAQAEAKNQTLEVKIAPGLPPIECEPKRVQQVLVNLLGNAVKFTPEGGKIVVSAAPVSEGVLFSVEDSGPGIPKENLERVFDRYWQAAETRWLGTGLGLSIAKGIVQAHHGRIWAESEAGQGARFRFFIPLAKADQAEEAPPFAAEPRAV